jgi:hypothetical protein
MDLPGWLGAVFGLFAVIVSFVIYRLQRARKSLSYRVVANSDLLSANVGPNTTLQVVHANHALTEPRLMVLEITNTGNAEIRAEDFAEPFRIKLKDAIRIESVTIAKTRPNGLPVQTIQPDPLTIELAPLLLNPGDQFILEVLLDGKAAEVEATGRVAGVKQISNLSPTKEPRTRPRRAYPAIIQMFSGLVGGLVVAAVCVPVLVSAVDQSNSSSSNQGYYSGSTSSAQPSPPFDDGADAKTTGCGNDASTIEDVPVAGLDGTQIADLRLQKSSRCQTAWAQVQLSKPIIGTVALTVTRVRDAMSTTFTKSLGIGSAPPAQIDFYTYFSSAMVNVDKDCAKASVVISLAGKQVQAESDCRG